ncbi:unnamed protein product [Notodromas monacha]|uniref:UAS domain-containing protein n=1 Tax=Notodromas monacha TaxID=399045 RepID=A0A7R9GA56_9CRUS|nr:unnamed protein product [Notodromas monacha]CAG0914980.1 unnamed protein product [Notodromas monacha]
MASAGENGASSESNETTELVEQFCTITGAPEETAKSLLEACSGNLAMAINMLMESDEPAVALAELSAPSGSSSSSTAFDAGPSLENDPHKDDDSDNLRAPILPTRGVLVDGLHYSAVNGRQRIRNSRFSTTVRGLRDFQAETREREDRLRRGLPPGYDNSKLNRLEDIFRPPIDLIFTGSFDEAKEFGARENRWLLVNIQNNQEFKCQVLNRDVWSDKRIKKLVREHFVFWQAYNDTDDGERFSMFYPVTKWPYIAVLDPRTGENLAQWHDDSPGIILNALTDFLSEHSAPSDSSGPPKRPRTGGSQDRLLIDMSEDSQLEAAIRASLEEKHIEDVGKLESEPNSDIDAFTDDDTNSSFPSPFFSSKASGSGSTSKEVGESSTASAKRNLNEAMCTSKLQGEDAWREFAGNPDDPESRLLLRLPDGKKIHISMPCSSQIQAVIVYAEFLGFPPSKLCKSTDVMFGSLKERLSVVQEGLSASFKGLSVGEVNKFKARSGSTVNANFDPNCGADLLHHYQTEWAGIHVATESNAGKARSIDRQICDLHSWLESQWETIHQLNRHLAALPGLVDMVDQALESIGILQGLFEEVEDAMMHLEDIQETQALREKQLDHRFQFALYKEKKLGNLKDLRSCLAREHAENLRLQQEREEIALKERQAVFKQAFEEEIEDYKRSGRLRQLDHSDHASRLKLEDVTVEEDTSALDSFLEDPETGKDEPKASSS